MIGAFCIRTSFKKQVSGMLKNQKDLLWYMAYLLLGTLKSKTPMTHLSLGG